MEGSAADPFAELEAMMSLDGADSGESDGDGDGMDELDQAPEDDTPPVPADEHLGALEGLPGGPTVSAPAPPAPAPAPELEPESELAVSDEGAAAEATAKAEPADPDTAPQVSPKAGGIKAKWRQSTPIAENLANLEGMLSELKDEVMNVATPRDGLTAAVEDDSAATTAAEDDADVQAAEGEEEEEEKESAQAKRAALEMRAQAALDARAEAARLQEAAQEEERETQRAAEALVATERALVVERQETERLRAQLADSERLRTRLPVPEPEPEQKPPPRSTRSPRDPDAPKPSPFVTPSDETDWTSLLAVLMPPDHQQQATPYRASLGLAQDLVKRYRPENGDPSASLLLKQVVKRLRRAEVLELDNRKAARAEADMNGLCRDLKSEKETVAHCREELAAAKEVVDKEVRKRRAAVRRQQLGEQLLHQADEDSRVVMAHLEASVELNQLIPALGMAAPTQKQVRQLMDAAGVTPKQPGTKVKVKMKRKGRKSRHQPKVLSNEERDAEFHKLAAAREQHLERPEEQQWPRTDPVGMSVEGEGHVAEFVEENEDAAELLGLRKAVAELVELRETVTSPDFVATAEKATPRGVAIVGAGVQWPDSGKGLASGASSVDNAALATMIEDEAARFAWEEAAACVAAMPADGRFIDVEERMAEILSKLPDTPDAPRVAAAALAAQVAGSYSTLSEAHPPERQQPVFSDSASDEDDDAFLQYAQFDLPEEDEDASAAMYEEEKAQALAERERERVEEALSPTLRQPLLLAQPEHHQPPPPPEPVPVPEMAPELEPEPVHVQPPVVASRHEPSAFELQLMARAATAQQSRLQSAAPGPIASRFLQSNLQASTSMTTTPAPLAAEAVPEAITGALAVQFILQHADAAVSDPLQHPEEAYRDDESPGVEEQELTISGIARPVHAEDWRAAVGAAVEKEGEGEEEDEEFFGADFDDGESVEFDGADFDDDDDDEYEEWEERVMPPDQQAEKVIQAHVGIAKVRGYSASPSSGKLEQLPVAMGIVRRGGGGGGSVVAKARARAASSGAL